MYSARRNHCNYGYTTSNFYLIVGAPLHILQAPSSNTVFTHGLQGDELNAVVATYTCVLVHTISDKQATVEQTIQKLLHRQVRNTLSVSRLNYIYFLFLQTPDSI